MFRFDFCLANEALFVALVGLSPPLDAEGDIMSTIEADIKLSSSRVV